MHRVNSFKIPPAYHANPRDRLTQRNDLIRVPFETVIVADDEELVEILDAPDLLRQIPPSFFVHIGRRLVEECDVNFRKLFQQRQTDGQSAAAICSPPERFRKGRSRPSSSRVIS